MCSAYSRAVSAARVGGQERRDGLLQNRFRLGRGELRVTVQCRHDGVVGDGALPGLVGQASDLVRGERARAPVRGERAWARQRQRSLGEPQVGAVLIGGRERALRRQHLRCLAGPAVEGQPADGHRRVLGREHPRAGGGAQLVEVAAGCQRIAAALDGHGLDPDRGPGCGVAGRPVGQSQVVGRVGQLTAYPESLAGLDEHLGGLRALQETGADLVVGEHFDGYVFQQLQREAVQAAAPLGGHVVKDDRAGRRVRELLVA